MREEEVITQKIHIQEIEWQGEQMKEKATKM